MAPRQLKIVLNLQFLKSKDIEYYLQVTYNQSTMKIISFAKLNLFYLTFDGLISFQPQMYLLPCSRQGTLQ